MNKKGIFFSTDAIIALMLILLSVIIIYPILNTEKHENFMQRDIIDVLSSIKVGEINNSYVKNLISDGSIKDLNKSMLEQIGEFYVTDIDIAKILAQTMISSIDTKENIGIWYGSTLLASRNETPFEDAQNIMVERQTISGIQQGSGVTGFSARAYFSSNVQTKYFYFGGYVGEGNLTARMEYEGNITNATMELAINKDFEVYINGINSGNYNKSISTTNPKNYILPIDNFISGINTIELKGDNLNVAGGYIKLIYTSGVQYTKQEKYNFPGIDGFVNLYDSFYIPGIINKIDLSLHLNSSQPLFLKIGNVTLFNNITNGEETIILTNAELSSKLNYGELSKKTIPLRLGLENTSYIFNITKDADVFSVTDLSGSMGASCDGGGLWCCLTGDCSTESGCASCGGTLENKIEEAKEANKVFVDSVLNESGNQVGLIGYRSTVNAEDFHELSEDNISLKNEIDSWYASGGTCICCGINEATDHLVANSNPQNFRSMVVMSDGEANEECARQGTGDAQQDAINAACEAYENHNIIVYAVGFGDGAELSTLQSIANCGNGEYFYSDVSELNEIYEQIAQDIIEASYSEQTVEISGNYESTLYPDSYIEFNYTKEPTPFGLTMVNEEQFIDQNNVNFDIPENSTILETKIISYSGSKWTNEVKINSNSIFNLTDYGSEYLELGDPCSINIPNSFVNDTNYVTLTTSLSPFNSTGGSINNKVIYHISKQFKSYSPISSLANGCVWTIEFEDSTNTTIKIPENYTGSDLCQYTETRIEYNSNDAIQTATYELLKDLDFNLNDKIDIKFTEQNFNIDTSKVSGIPYDWSTEVQIRKWS